MTNRKTYAQIENELLQRYPDGTAPGGIQIEDLIQVKIQNTFNTHLDIAKDMAKVMRA